MIHGFGLRIEPVESGDPVEAKFSELNILFLISNDFGLSLCSEPARGGLIHAMFLFKKGRVVAIPLRDDLYLKRGCVSQLENNEILRLGSRKWRVVLVGQCAARKIKALIFFLVLFILFSALVTSFVRRNDSKNVQILTAEQAEPKAKFKTSLIEEAKTHMRSGQAEQARLALMDVLDRDPTNAEAVKLLNAVKGDITPAKSHTHVYDLDIVARAKKSYESGRQLMRKRNYSEAHEMFERAVNELSSVNAAVPFRSALLDAKKQSLYMLKAEMLPKLVKAKGLFKSAAQKETKEAINLLTQALVISESAVKSLPHNSEATSLHIKIRDEINAASQRWLFAAQTVERLSGCRQAVYEYERIADALQNIEPNSALIARKRLSRCRAFEGSGL